MQSNIGWRDWALAAIGVLFTALGLTMLRDPAARDHGIVVVTFFGLCAIVGIAGIVRKRRESRPIAGVARVRGGVPIKPSRLRIVLLGVAVLAVGVVMLVFGGDAPLPVEGAAWVAAVAGAAVLLGVATGRLPNQHLEFRETGMVIAHRGWQVLLPWDGIRALAGGDYQRNPALFLWLHAPETCVVTPHEKQPAFLKQVKQARTWMQADVFLMTTHYGFDLPVLLAALERYRLDPPARRELAATWAPDDAVMLEHP